jgi:ribosomal protein L4
MKLVQPMWTRQSMPSRTPARLAITRNARQAHVSPATISTVRMAAAQPARLAIAKRARLTYARNANPVWEKTF